MLGEQAHWSLPHDSTCTHVYDDSDTLMKTSVSGVAVNGHFTCHVAIPHTAQCIFRGVSEVASGDSKASASVLSFLAASDFDLATVLLLLELLYC